MVSNGEEGGKGTHGACGKVDALALHRICHNAVSENPLCWESFGNGRVSHQYHSYGEAASCERRIPPGPFPDAVEYRTVAVGKYCLGGLSCDNSLSWCFTGALRSIYGNCHPADSLFLCSHSGAYTGDSGRLCCPYVGLDLEDLSCLRHTVNRGIDLNWSGWRIEEVG